MNNTVKIFVITVGIILTYKYLKKKKENSKKDKSDSASIKKLDEDLTPNELDQIRINLLDYIEARNAAEGKEISRIDIDADIMLITTVK